MSEGLTERRRFWSGMGSPRRLLGLALVAALAMLSMRTCAAETATVELRFRYGAAAARVRGIRVDTLRAKEGAPVAYMERTYRDGAAAAGVDGERQTIPLAAGEYTLRIRLWSTAGTREITRRLDARNGETTTIDLEADVP
jgi:hypothetical protein